MGHLKWNNLPLGHNLRAWWPVSNTTRRRFKVCPTNYTAVKRSRIRALCLLRVSCTFRLSRRGGGSVYMKRSYENLTLIESNPRRELCSCSVWCSRMVDKFSMSIVLKACYRLEFVKGEIKIHGFLRKTGTWYEM